MRPKLRKESYDRGIEAEQRIHDWLTNQKIEHVWLNENGETHSRGDFLVRNGIRLEVEHKAFGKYKSLIEKDGIDFLADKVEKHAQDTIYVMEVDYGFYAARMSTIRKLGRKVQKETGRGGKEWFYRMPLDLLFHVEYHPQE